jgi:hypothetical protein
VQFTGERFSKLVSCFEGLIEELGVGSQAEAATDQIS